jgi:hypothetical protein
MRGSSLERGPARWACAAVVAAAILLALRAAPLAAAYVAKLRGLHPASLVALAAAAGALGLGALALGLSRSPRAASWALAGLALFMVVPSGNLGALAWAIAVLAGTLVLGDAVARVLLGFEVEAGDLTAAFALGLTAAGLLVLGIAEAGLFSRPFIGIFAGALAAARFRRLPRLARLVAESCRVPRGDAPPAVEAAWLAFAAVVLVACWAAAQSPDASWDALAYHLPQARAIAATGAAAPLLDSTPQSLLWHNHDVYFALGFLCGGERVVQLLQFGVGLAVFGAALTLARRLGAGGAAPLIVLSLAAFPTAMLQLHAAYVDWPAALLVTAAAAQLAPRPAGASRARAAGLLLGGAIVTKIFAIFALPAMALLAWRARLSRRAIAAASVCALVPVVCWMAWSQRHAGSFLSPYADSPAELLTRAARGHYFTTSPASGAARPARSAVEVVRGVLRLPYDVVFHSSRFEGNRDGYNGLLALLLLLGVAGWGPAGAARFLAAALPFVIPWSLLYIPSIRFLLPVYPLYAVFTAEGLRRFTRGFAGRPGVLAGLAVFAAACLFPVQLGSSGDEWRLAFGRMSRDAFLEARLPAWPLWRRLEPRDRVLLVGENDRYHCPAEAAWRHNFQPVASWGDREAWNRGLAQLGITHVLWRTDREPRLPAGLPADRLVLLARNGAASLYGLGP